jgi:hypothetical protein
MSDNNNAQIRTGGIGFGGMLAILFIGLKLTGYIDWSWWWVLSPLWIPVAIILGVVAVILAFAAIVWSLASLCELFFAKKPKPRQPNKFRGL